MAAVVPVISGKKLLIKNKQKRLPLRSLFCYWFARLHKVANYKLSLIFILNNNLQIGVQAFCNRAVIANSL
jgi:hypothetical protein